MQSTGEPMGVHMSEPIHKQWLAATDEQMHEREGLRWEAREVKAKGKGAMTTYYATKLSAFKKMGEVEAPSPAGLSPSVSTPPRRMSNSSWNTYANGLLVPSLDGDSIIGERDRSSAAHRVLDAVCDGVNVDQVHAKDLLALAGLRPGVVITHVVS